MDDKMKKYVEMAEDATFQARTGRSKAPERVEWYRGLWNDRKYDEIVKAFQGESEDTDIYAYAASYASMSHRALGNVDASIMALLKGMARVPTAVLESKLLNQLAIRLYAKYRDLDLPEEIVRHAWEDVYHNGDDRGWDSALSICEFKLLRARENKASMPETLAEMDRIIGEVLDSFDWEKDQEFINYMHRYTGFSEYRESEYFAKRFGHTAAK